MPTIVYYPEPIIAEISMEEFMRRESAPVRIHEETGRMARRAIAEYDECVAEMSAEKQNRREKYMRTHKVRNDGKSVSKDKGRKYIKEMEYRLDPWVNKNGCEMVNHYRSMVAEKSVREDWEIDLQMLEYDIDYSEMDIDSIAEDIDDIDHEMQLIEYQLSDMENLKKRLEDLKKFRKEAEGYMQNAKDFLKQYAFVKEMM